MGQKIKFTADNVESENVLLCAATTVLPASLSPFQALNHQTRPGELLRLPNPRGLGQ